MKLLIDMNLSPMWVQYLAKHGFSVSHWSEVGRSSDPDSVIMQWAYLHQHVILTQDLDFGIALAASGAEAPSVIQIRSDILLPAIIGSQVVAALQELTADLESGALVTLTPRKTKMRVLPIRQLLLDDFRHRRRGFLLNRQWRPPSAVENPAHHPYQHRQRYQSQQRQQ